MKKILGMVTAVVFFSARFLTAMESSSVAVECTALPNQETMIIQNIEDLKPYYEAIHQIRIALEKEGAAFGFKARPLPFNLGCRTPKYLFLETSVVDKFLDTTDVIAPRENCCCLYTPFGRIRLDEDHSISKKFLANMNWILEDVTQTVKRYNYSQKNNAKYGPSPFKKESYYGAGDQSKLYLIKSVNSVSLFPKDSKEELMFFDYLSLTDEQDKKDDAQFMILSEGKMCF